MPFQSKIILTIIVATIVASVGFIATRYFAPVWQTAERAIGDAISTVVTADVSDSPTGLVNVPAGASVSIIGTDVTVTNESVAASDLSQPFDALYIVTLKASRGNQTMTFNLSRSQPAGYVDQPSAVWNGYRFTLVKANPLGAQSATVQVQPQA